ncbi:hypothetical protein CES86_3027 [Brucella lupini]|uniref:Uncharacterized protein n=1 Tax=Brucella lupini TaxID=255457 RepID=A0A256GLS0_9HYPH|nr:hypothetical protein CES86_3027 [Brucella lupini]
MAACMWLAADDSSSNPQRSSKAPVFRRFCYSARTACLP